MSVKNKAKDRDHYHRIRRKYTGQISTFWLNKTPKWWLKMYMTRPKRRANKNVCIAIMQGTDPDGIVAPLGNVALNKPVTRIIMPDTYIFKFF